MADPESPELVTRLEPLPGPEEPWIRFRPHTTAVMIGDCACTHVFDLEGRLLWAHLGSGLPERAERPEHYRRSLNGRVLETGARAGRHPVQRLRRELSLAERKAFLDGLADQMRKIIASYRAGAVRSLCDVAGLGGAELDERLSRISSWNGAKLEDDGARFTRAYRSVAILPPDQYLALFVQLTEGCPYNRCTFCGFYQDRPFRVRSLPELEVHLREVLSLFGRALPLRRSTFIGDANALVLSQERLVDAIHLLKAVLPRELHALYAFADVPATLRKSAAELGELRELGLRRVYIGMETGDDELRTLISKPGTSAEFVEAVRTVRDAGIAIGIIMLAGLGGKQYSANHIRATVDTLNQLELDSKDLLYFSPLVSHPGSPYAEWAAKATIEPLSPDETAAQIQAIRAGLRALRTTSHPPTAIYDIGEFLY